MSKKLTFPGQIKSAAAYATFLEVVFEDGTVKRIAWETMNPVVTNRHDFHVSRFGSYIEWPIDDITFSAETFYFEFTDKDIGVLGHTGSWLRKNRATREEAVVYGRRLKELDANRSLSKESE